MSAPSQPRAKQLGAMSHNAETCYIAARTHDAEPWGLNLSLVLLGVQNVIIFERKRLNCKSKGPQSSD